MSMDVNQIINYLCVVQRQGIPTFVLPFRARYQAQCPVMKQCSSIRYFTFGVQQAYIRFVFFCSWSICCRGGIGIDISTCITISYLLLLLLLQFSQLASLFFFKFIQCHSHTSSVTFHILFQCICHLLTLQFFHDQYAGCAQVSVCLWYSYMNVFVKSNVAGTTIAALEQIFSYSVHLLCFLLVIKFGHELFFDFFKWWYMHWLCHLCKHFDRPHITTKHSFHFWILYLDHHIPISIFTMTVFRTQRSTMNLTNTRTSYRRWIK
mmetsp:Transcript_4391/g.6438  ORF Transcript_4391/g.6438 Transcript_4391/m.6438 type:complete len:264 (-) Transcript_4391:273-1064(-)